MTFKFTDEQRDELRSFMGEGIHTAFRKGADAPEAMQIHRLISQMPDAEWGNAVAFVADPVLDYVEAIVAKAADG